MRLRPPAHPAQSRPAGSGPAPSPSTGAADCAHAFQNPRSADDADRPLAGPAPPGRRPRSRRTVRPGELARRRHRARRLPRGRQGVLPVHQLRRARPHRACRAGARRGPRRGGPPGAAHHARHHRTAARPLRRGQHVPPPGARPRSPRRTARRAGRTPPRRPPRDRGRRPGLRLRHPPRPPLAAAQPPPPAAAAQPGGRTPRPGLRDHHHGPHPPAPGPHHGLPLPAPLRAPLAAATALDHLLAPLTRHTRFANTYRVVARTPGRPPARAVASRAQPRSTSACPATTSSDLLALGRERRVQAARVRRGSGGRRRWRGRCRSRPRWRPPPPCGVARGPRRVSSRTRSPQRLLAAVRPLGVVPGADRVHDVGQPQREAVDQQGRAVLGQQGHQVAGLRRPPGARTPLAVRGRPGPPTRGPRRGCRRSPRTPRPGRTPGAVRPPPTCPSVPRPAPASGAARPAPRRTRPPPASPRPVPSAPRPPPAAGATPWPCGTSWSRWTATTSVAGPTPPAARSRASASGRPTTSARTMSYGSAGRSRPAGEPPGGRYSSREPVRPGHLVPGAARVHRQRPHPMPRQQRQLAPVRHPDRLRQPGRHLHGGPVVRVGQQHLAHPAQRVPGAGRRERRARGQVQQQGPVHQQRGGRARVRAERSRAHGTGAGGAGQPRGGAGAEQSDIHGTDFHLSRRPPRTGPPERTIDPRCPVGGPGDRIRCPQKSDRRRRA